MSAVEVLRRASREVPNEQFGEVFKAIEDVEALIAAAQSVLDNIVLCGTNEGREVASALARVQGGAA